MFVKRPSCSEWLREKPGEPDMGQETDVNQNFREDTCASRMPGVPLILRAPNS